MRILIIGSKGVLGQELIKVFSDFQVIPWDKEEIDITKEKEVKKKIADLKPEIIINSAAYNDVDGAEKNENLANQVNGYAVGYLAQAAKHINALFIHYSSDYIFEGLKKEGYKEEDKPNPRNAYGRSKLLGEELMQKENGKNFKFRYYLIRLSRLFGSPAKSETAKKSFVELMLTLSQKKDILEIIDEELSSPTYACHLAKKTKEIIKNNDPYGIYHGANQGACTWYGFVREIFKIKNIKAEVKPIKGDRFFRLAPRPLYSVLLNTKLRPMPSWQEALKEYLI